MFTLGKSQRSHCIYVMIYSLILKKIRDGHPTDPFKDNVQFILLHSYIGFKTEMGHGLSKRNLPQRISEKGHSYYSYEIFVLCDFAVGHDNSWLRSGEKSRFSLCIMFKLTVWDIKSVPETSVKKNTCHFYLQSSWKAWRVCFSFLYECYIYVCKGGHICGPKQFQTSFWKTSVHL